jgi:hypothetical protein
MKRLLFTLSFLCLFSGYIFSQENILKTNPIGLAFGNFNVTYEKVISDKASVLGSVNYVYKIFGVDVNTFGLGVAYRYYITHAKKAVPSGFYVNPQLGFAFGSSDDVNYNTVSIGAELGYQWAWDSGMVLDVGIGPNYVNLGGDYEDIDFDNDSGIFPSITIALGYAW